MMDMVLRLREARRLRGLTQRDVGRLSGVGEKTVSSFETGARIESLKLSQLRKLLAVYEISLAEFVSENFEYRALGEQVLEQQPAFSHLLAAISDLPKERRTRLIRSFQDMTELARQSERRGQRLA